MERTRATVIGLALAALTCAVYLPVLSHAFVAYDDPEYLTANPVVPAGLTWSGVQWAFTTFHAANWHPVTWLSHLLDVELFGAGPAGPHAVNLLLHVANALLLFHLLRRLTGTLGRSACVAALFALHPLHVESVAWAAERKDVLSACFFFLTLIAYNAYVTSRRASVLQTPTSSTAEPASARQTPYLGATAWYLAALLLFALGLMSKPMLVTLPFVLLLLDYWPLLRAPHAALRALLVEKIPFFALSVVSCLVTMSAQAQGGALRPLAGLSFFERLANVPVAYARYLAKTLWPDDLAFFYPHPGRWSVVVVGAATIGLVTLTVAAFRAARRLPFIATGWLWFCGMLVPVIGLVQAGGQSIADRYTYLPLVGLFIALVWGATEVARRWSLRPAWLAAAATLTLLACAARTARQIPHWRDSEALFRHALAVTEKNHVAHNNLGGVLLDRGETDAAVAHFRAALAIDPRFADAANNLGHALLQQGRLAEAVDHLQAALAHAPDDTDLLINLGKARLQEGRVADAIALFSRVLEFVPRHAKAHNNLGCAFAQSGRFDAAISHFEQALAAEPGYVNAQLNLRDAVAAAAKSSSVAQRPL